MELFVGWSVLLKKVKDQGSLGYLLNFPQKNDPPLKIEILQHLDLGLLLEAEMCTFGTLIFLYNFFFLFVYFTDQKRYFTDWN